MNKLLVYGTLRKGHGNHPLIQHSVWRGTVMVPGTMVDLGSFPGYIDKGNTLVVCELYEVDEATLERVDRLEGNGRFYTRIQKPTAFGDAWVYALPESYLKQPHVITGDWSAYVNGAKHAPTRAALPQPPAPKEDSTKPLNLKATGA